jgi:tRNA dimethylallyltransferase
MERFPGDKNSGAAKIPVVVIFGPTASGKTAVLSELFTGSGKIALAEVVSADSMQVYRGLDTGTAKPDAELRKKLPHHLIDICSPAEQFTAGDFARMAAISCKTIFEKGALPVVSGGTGFYLSALLYGIPETPKVDLEIRDALKKELALHGREALFDELESCDPGYAAKISHSDTYRLLRALEVYRSTNQPLSSFSRTSKTFTSEFDFLVLSLEWERKILYQRIEERCKKMFSSGLYMEVKKLFDEGFTPACPALRAIGYREFFTLSDEANNIYTLRSDIENVYQQILLDTRHYAKRQITWFKQMKNIIHIEMPHQKELLKNYVSDFLREGNIYAA